MNSTPRSPIAHTASRRRQILRAACYFFLALGIVALAYVGFVLADSHLYEAAELHQLDQAIPPADPTDPHPPAEGDALGEIQVPRLGLSAVVIQGDSRANLRRGVAHLTNSPLPGESGNIALAGHRDTFFRPLRDIRVGDEIIFKTPARRYEYIVESFQVVAPTDVSVLNSTPARELTLLTCFPFYYVGPAPKRFVVRARESETAPNP
jgi:sortase A